MTLLGQRLFAVSFIAFGLLPFLDGDFMPGRPTALLCEQVEAD